MSDDLDNPFAPSRAAAAAAAGVLPLYSETACLVTTFFATPIGAAPLLMMNASRTGQSPFVVGAMAALVFVAVVVIGMVPLPLPNIVFTIMQIMLIRQLYLSWFGVAVAMHKEDGIEPAPWMHAALICLGGFTLQMAFVGLLVWAVGLEGLADL